MREISGTTPIGLGGSLGELVRSRDLHWSRVVREIKIRYLRERYGRAAAEAEKGILTAACRSRSSLSPVAALVDRSRNARTATLVGNDLGLIRALPGP
jgi:hypothetical protein